jgi:hypothetical protein
MPNKEIKPGSYVKINCERSESHGQIAGVYSTDDGINGIGVFTIWHGRVQKLSFEPKEVILIKE